jgi:antitoxin (DNA-binding transcriptional repressor) of toxin-antitoxin stability system
MERAVSAAVANRKFSQLLRSVREGRSYVVTTHGKPVALAIRHAVRSSLPGFRDWQ